MNHKVSINRLQDSIDQDLVEVIPFSGGMEKLAKPSGHFLLKPNLFTTITADKGVTTTLWRITYITHPMIHQPWSR
jgi:uncharacterized protein (DUF362 family)